METYCEQKQFTRAMCAINKEKTWVSLQPLKEHFVVLG